MIAFLLRRYTYNQCRLLNIYCALHVHQQRYDDNKLLQKARIPARKGHIVDRTNSTRMSSSPCRVPQLIIDGDNKVPGPRVKSHTARKKLVVGI